MGKVSTDMPWVIFLLLYELFAVSAKHIGNNIQPSQLWDLENKASNDIIVLTWVDYKQQLVGAVWETAKKTNSRNTAQQKRTNKILKKNSFSFYNRLAKLRLADMQFINTIADEVIPLKWNNQIEGGFLYYKKSS